MAHLNYGIKKEKKKRIEFIKTHFIADSSYNSLASSVYTTHPPIHSSPCNCNNSLPGVRPDAGISTGCLQFSKEVATPSYVAYAKRHPTDLV